MHEALKATKKKQNISSLTKMILIMSFSAVEQPYQTVPFFQRPWQPLNSALQEVTEDRKKKKKKKKVHQWSRKSEAREKVETGH